MTNLVSFFCKKCNLDQNLQAHKETVMDVEFWKARCTKCGNFLVRYITHMSYDPYYWESRKLKVERYNNRKDFIQPDQEGFQTYYKESWLKNEKMKEGAYQKKTKEKAEAEKALKRVGSDVEKRRIIKKLYEEV